MEHLRLVFFFGLVLCLGMNTGDKICDFIQPTVANCRAKNLRAVPVVNTSEIVELHLDDNPLERLTSSTFTYWKDGPLRKLFLSKCQIRFIDTDTFKPLTELRHLVLKDNLLTFGQDLRSASFRGLGNLIKLDMSENPLGTIPNNAFSELTKLESLTIKNTKQGLKLNSQSFNGLKTVRELYLFNNDLVTLPAGMRDSLDWAALRTFDAVGNDFHCDCHLQWLNKLRLKSDSIYGNCASPSRMKGTKLYTGQPEQYWCVETIDMTSEEASTIQCHQFAGTKTDIEEMKTLLSDAIVNPTSMGNGWHCFGDTDNKELLLEVSKTLKMKK